MKAQGGERCWLCNERPIRDDGPGVGAVGRETEAGKLIYCAACVGPLRRALAAPRNSDG